MTRHPGPSFVPLEETIRAELFSIERLEQHGESLASSQTVTDHARHGRRLSPRVRENARVLLEVYRAIAEAVRDERVITPAAEWLVDNFHIVEDQIREIREDLPIGYYRELPKLAGGHLAGYPRVFGIAWAFVAHTDSRFEPETLLRFVRSYQRVQPLTIGELWAIPITLRVVLVENLRRLAQQVVRERSARQEADQVADRLLGLDSDPATGEAILRREVSRAVLPRAFTVRLVQRLRDQDPDTTPALRWLNERLVSQGTSSDEIVRAEHQAQAAMNVTVRNVITSMRLMSTFDWNQFFEDVSLVDEALRVHPGYAQMDFATRDRYRHAIEDLARGTGHGEIEIARRAVSRALLARTADHVSRRDPGYYLISKGRLSFERDLGFRVRLGQRLKRLYVGAATPTYLGSIAFVTLGILAIPILRQSTAPGSSLAPTLLMALLALIPASDLAIAIVNRFVVSLVRPRLLPKLEIKGAVPGALCTLVAVPTMLTGKEEIAELIERLEVHYLANSEEGLCFALLTDWTDAPEETQPTDEPLLAAAADGIARLNERHGPLPDGGDRFLLLHRKRLWNPSERKWIGWERKRGKLHELNRLLRGAKDTTFVPVAGRAPKVSSDVRYVITLDSDTRLPRDAARKLIGTLAHPLMQPLFDASARRVVEGYSVLQPRITCSLPTPEEDTFYRRIFSGPAGIDPYAAAASEVYQDLFAEGSYAGKGIYEVDAFERSLEGRIPENALLSHDLFEGIFARAACGSDIEMVEDFPARYEVAAARQHRWARGDWQLLPWILGIAKDARGRLRRAGVPALGRWKMVDNLRRSLSPVAALATLVAGWLVPSAPPWLWTVFVLMTVAVPPFFPVLDGILPRRQGISKRTHLMALASDVTTAAGIVASTLALMAHQAWLMGDAIIRTLVRLFVTGRNRLAWVTAAHAGSRFDLGIEGLLRRLAGASLLGIASLAAVALWRPALLAAAAPFALAWMATPWIVRRISLPSARARSADPSPEQARILRETARRTWLFFETFVGPEDNYLPPDNFQQDPKPEVAHRTSPTNIGLYLLSITAARDFGWIGVSDAATRLETTFAAIQRLERHRGHLFNWYDTRTLQPLEPRYISSVDSGNLAGHLITLAEACRQMARHPLLDARALAGIEDAALVLRQAGLEAAKDKRTQIVTRQQLAEALEEFLSLLQVAPTTTEGWAGLLEDLASRAGTLVDMTHTISSEGGGDPDSEAVSWSLVLKETVASHRRDLDMIPLQPPPGRPQDAPSYTEVPRSLASRLRGLAGLADEMANATDFAFLYDPTRKLLSIGQRVGDGRLDGSFYDLLASEARLTSFLAIAKGDVPTDHWFRLGRPLTPVEAGSALISWSGSMFEYLMPALVMDSPPGSLLDQTYRLVIRRQIRYGAEHGVPWGISESAFSARDLSRAYQYSNFGVPGLGLKRGLAEDLVVSPYATALAAMVEPAAAADNFESLARAGALGRYGFFEALDYTGARLLEKQEGVVVSAYMAHHQGMTIVALANVLQRFVMRSRFHALPLVQAADLLLQERMPRDLAVARPRAEEVGSDLHVRDLVPPVLRRFTTANDPTPRTHLLSNGRYVVMMTAAGSGYSNWQRFALSRWREDTTRDGWGSWVYLRDPQNGQIWSAGYQPVGVEPETYEVAYSEDRIEIRRRDGAIACAYEIVVSPEDDAEVRRVSLTNLGTRVRQIELTSYAEIVLAPAASDEAHPAFSKLFVQTEFASEVGALLATRRPRGPDEESVYAAHLVTVEGETIGNLQYETDRNRFIGRGRSVRDPFSVTDGRPLSNTTGSVLDPIFSFRIRVRIEPGATARVTFTTLAASTREQAIDLADKHRDAGTFERTMTLAWTRAQVQLLHLDIAPDEAHLFQRLANRILYSDPTLRPPADVIKRNILGAPGLWAHGISGDTPIVLVRVEEVEEREIVRQLLRAHEYWRMKGLSVDLVILNEKATSYAQELQSTLEAMARATQAALRHEGHEAHGGIFVLRADLVTPADRDLLRTAARAVLAGRDGTLAEQLVRTLKPLSAGRSVVRPPAPSRAQADAGATVPPLEFYNGLGGFADGGREYVVALGEGQWTPAPWINVIANPGFGFQVSESGSGYTWAANSRENQITPWSNDPVCDPTGEAFYVRDEETGEVWTPTALPIREETGRYIARHGHGYTIFQRASHGIALELLQFVPLEDPVKVSRLRIENRSSRPRRLSVTGYVEWVLGVSRARNAPFIVTERDPNTGALLARNPWNAEFADRVAFYAIAHGTGEARKVSVTSDRTEFFGRNGGADRPAALAREDLSGRLGAGFDPCGALRTVVDVPAGRHVDVVFLLGQGAARQESLDLAARYTVQEAEMQLDRVRRHWDELLGAVQIRTPDRSMDLLVNRWLLYQVLSCRLWARSAFYQAGGAYGFRDQLQDVMALLTARPAIAREQILRAASRQFLEGDVQHWWHVPSGRGVRTRISDDLLWLPYVAAEYLEATGDASILEESVRFLEGPSLSERETQSYFHPIVSDTSATLFEHCARALDRSLATGAHGLPLIGAGDWNDGFDRVGHLGRGESVWLGWFLISALKRFAPLAEARGDAKRAGAWTQHAQSLERSLENEAWDGDWYLRAFFDDGTPIGSAASPECRIDSIAQSWGVISGAAPQRRAARAMAALEQHLVRRGDNLVLLFTPPFDRAPVYPGYIKGYLPGVRENGGQYTHAAVWALIAFAMLGEGDKAAEVFAMINPINDASTRASVHRYKVEPYVVAADVYSEPPHTGRGGWTWYTGSAGWMYRAATEWILGLRVGAMTPQRAERSRGPHEAIAASAAAEASTSAAQTERDGRVLVIDPCIPRWWRNFEVQYRYGSSTYRILVENPRGAARGVSSIEVDGQVVPRIAARHFGPAQPQPAAPKEETEAGAARASSWPSRERAEPAEDAGALAAASQRVAVELNHLPSEHAPDSPRAADQEISLPAIPLRDDGGTHTVRVVMGEP